MLKIKGKSVAGTLESSDVLVEVAPGCGVSIEIESVVKAQFGEAIEKTLRDVLAEFDVENASVRVVDRGALDCTIRARLETAIRRASKEED
ncbi:MAG: citrate lyase acyl carrier protein [Pyramidobacter sp.]